jgi:hypothetical protein
VARLHRLQWVVWEPSLCIREVGARPDADRKRACNLTAQKHSRAGIFSRATVSAVLAGIDGCPDCRFLGSSDDFACLPLRYGPPLTLIHHQVPIVCSPPSLLFSSLTTPPRLSFETDIAFPLLLRQVLLEIASILHQLKPNTAL